MDTHCITHYCTPTANTVFTHEMVHLTSTQSNTFEAVVCAAVDFFWAPHVDL